MLSRIINNTTMPYPNLFSMNPYNQNTTNISPEYEALISSHIRHLLTVKTRQESDLQAADSASRLYFLSTTFVPFEEKTDNVNSIRPSKCCRLSPPRLQSPVSNDRAPMVTRNCGTVRRLSWRLSQPLMYRCRVAMAVG